MIAGEKPVVLHQPVDFGEAQCRARQCGFDRRLVRGAAEARHQHPVVEDGAGDAGPGIGIDDADQLVHPRPLMHVFGLQRRSRETLVDIAHDRLGLVEGKAVVLEGRDLGEGLASQMRRFAVSAERHLDKLVGDALFGERQSRAPHIGAAGRTVNDRMRHHRSPVRICSLISGDETVAGGILAPPERVFQPSLPEYLSNRFQASSPKRPCQRVTEGLRVGIVEDEPVRRHPLTRRPQRLEQRHAHRADRDPPAAISRARLRRVVCCTLLSSRKPDRRA